MRNPRLVILGSTFGRPERLLSLTVIYRMSSAATIVPLRRYNTTYPAQDPYPPRTLGALLCTIQQPMPRVCFAIATLLGASVIFFAIGQKILGGRTDNNADALTISVFVGWAIISGIITVGAVLARYLAPSSPFGRSSAKVALGMATVAIYMGSLAPALGFAVVQRAHQLDVDGFSGLRALEAGSLGLTLVGGPVMLMFGYLYGVVES